MSHNGKSPWLAGLNPAQREAVTHRDPASPGLLVIAGAGTGKTRTLACRVAFLIDQGVPPGRILLLTFTRRAAAEMLAQARHMTGADRGAQTGRVWGGTFHAVANRLLRIHAGAIGLSLEFTVMDQGDAADMMNLIRTELGVAKGDRRFPRKRTLVSIYSRSVNAQDQLDVVLERHFPWCIGDLEAMRSIFEEYVQRKKTLNVLDYDDLLLYWAALCRTPGEGDTVADRFDHILVDEYQDTNPIQAEILLAMRKRQRNITVVGDDAQSIYSFRAATVRNILDFPRQFADTHIVTLEQNYRSTRAILSASNAVMADAKERYTKELWSDRTSGGRPVLITCLDEQEQCTAVCRRILAHREQGISLMGQAVLFRAGHHSDQLEIELARRNIPFRKFGGLKFIEAAHVKDMLAFLRIAENPYDEMSWFRVLQLLEGIGPRIARRVIDILFGRSGSPAENRGGPGEQAARALAVSPLLRLIGSDDSGGSVPSVPHAARDLFTQLGIVLCQCRGLTPAGSESPGPGAGSRRSAPPPATQIELIREFYVPIFKRTYENAPARIADLEQLELIATRYRSRARFITDLTLDPPEATSDRAQPPHLDDDYLTLSTIHSAKGCEWNAVHIIHAADGMIPSDVAVSDEAGIDEERRLFYVAMTRAKDWLGVYFPLRYYHRRSRRSDAHGYAQLTRFMGPMVREQFDLDTAEGSGNLDDESMQDRSVQAEGTRQTASDRVDSRLRKLWQDP